MKSEAQITLDEIFHAACALAPAERQRYISTKFARAMTRCAAKSKPYWNTTILESIFRKPALEKRRQGNGVCGPPICDEQTNR